MRWKLSRSLAGLAALGLGTTVADAGQVGYRINGGATQTITVSNTAPFTDIDIPVGDIAFNNFDLHIFDITTGGDPVDSVGMVTVRGQVTNGLPLVRVVVAAETLSDVGAAFVSATNPQPTGMRHLGGVQFLPTAPGSTDRSLLNRSKLSVNVLGDITGDITAGRVFRVDAQRTLAAPILGGTITGTIRSVRGDGQVDNGAGSITA